MKSCFEGFQLTQFNSILGGNLFSTQKLETGGSLLTPEEGCGLTKVKTNRIVGGSVAPVGAWPWMALLVYLQEDGLAFDCGNPFIPFPSSFFLLVSADM